MKFRTDRHNNPAAIITDLAKLAGLRLGIDYSVGDPLPRPNEHLNTARLLGDPVTLTIQVIDKTGYKTHDGRPRWTYANLPNWVWNGFTVEQKRDMIGYHYSNEGGTDMRPMFPNYGKP